MHPAKESIVVDLQAKLNASPFLFVADYTGLKVAQFAELRNRLWNVGARCHVVKNTFLRRAAQSAGLPELAELRGQTAIVVGDKDVAAAAKVLKNFTAEFKKPEMKMGVVDNLVVTTAQIQSIADLPSRDVLLATLLATLNAPASQLVRVLNEPAASLARLLQAKGEKDAANQPAAVEVAEVVADAIAEAPAAEAPAAEAPAAEAPAVEAPPAE